MKTTILTIAAVVSAAFTAQGAWVVGDPHKMHYPQLPDPNGWDIDATTDFIYDDWQCSETGPVSDVHFWISWELENIGQLSGVILEIRNDVPSGVNTNYSHPGDPLWSSGTLDPTQFAVHPWDPPGQQGWASPTIDMWNLGDHTSTFQVNIPTIPNPFVQQKDTIYWLGIHLIPASGDTSQPMAGWKTSQSDHFNDDAVFWDSNTPNPELPGVNGYWNELRDPNTGESLDMAFVITPEPGTAALALLGVGMFLRRRR